MTKSQFDADEDILRRRSGSPTRLNKPLDLNALLRDGNTTYDLMIDPMSQEDAFDAGDSEYSFRDKIFDHVNLAVLDGGDDDDDGADANLSPFEKIRKKMTKVTADGKIMKRIIKEGAGEVCPDKSHVKIHYQGYTEYKEVPFDVSYLRGKKPESHKLGDGYLLPSLDYSIQTMKAGETAWFLIHHDYAFGKLGCGQRIPKESTVLYEVNLVSFSENPDYLTSRPDEKLTFEDVVERAEGHLKKGNVRLTEDKDTDLAIEHYKEARDLILDFNLHNDKDDTLAKLLNRAYQNLAICHNKIQDFKSTVKLAESAMFIIRPIASKNVKLKFAWGKALSALNEYDEALSVLKEVKKIEPANKEVARELMALEEKMKQYEQKTKATAQRFFRTSESKPKQESSVKESFVKSMTEQLEQLKLNKKVRSLNLATGMTLEERKAVKNIAANLDLYYEEDKTFGEETIVIRKC